MEISEIKELVSLEQVIDWLELEPPNSAGKIRSPHHEDRTPSLHVYPDGTWHDFSTGKGGDVLDFVQMFFGCRIQDAIRWLECRIDEEVLVDLVRPQGVVRQRELTDFTSRFQQETQQLDRASEPVRRYALERWPAVSQLAISGHGVRCTYNALHIPHFSADGKVIGVKTRDIAGNRGAWKGSTFTTRPYGVAHAYAPGRTMFALIVEGEPDVWAATQMLVYRDLPIAEYGMPSGAGTWKDDWNAEILKYAGAIICTDNDEAGENARLLISDSLDRSDPFFRKWHLKLEKGKDLAEAMHVDLEHTLLQVEEAVTCLR
jgi:DNA primase